MSELRLVGGEHFIFGQADELASVWGEDDRVLWPAGEALWIVAPAGVGKTTLAQQIVLRRLGVPLGPLLGLGLEPDDRRVLYVAADRPRQIARSFRRMVDPAQASYLDALLVHHGPLPFMLDARPDALAQAVVDGNVGTVVIDSLKDCCGNLADSDVGSKVNRALQLVVAAGIEVVVLHHQRKAQADNKKPRTLSDVFGSAWLTAGAGSVALLWGDPGDIVVEFSHLKQPLADVGPLTLRHDHDRGVTTLLDQIDLLELCCERNGTTARDAAVLVYGKPSPERNDVEKIRRRLDQLVKAKKAEKIQPDTPGAAVVYWSVRDAHATSVRGSREGSRTPHEANTNGVTQLHDAHQSPLKGDVGQNVTHAEVAA